MGGHITSTFFTLIFIPALYLVMVEKLERAPALAGPEITETVGPPVKIEHAPAPEPEPPVIAPIQPEKPVTIYVAPALPNQAKLVLPAPKEKEPETSLPLPIIPVTEEKKPEAATTQAPAEEELNPRQKELLEKLKDLKKITRKEYAQLFKISVPTASRDLKELVDKKMLKAQGPLGPGRWYEPA